ncbi:MAG: site-specific integrase [Alphaproteobacteria bacterium]|nr:site-specific integrase [Alphaproteobacteria bacterium]
MSINNDFYRLWQHDNGTWYIIWSPQGEEKTNARGTKRISTRTGDRREAEQFRAQFIAGLNNETPKEEPTIAELLKLYRNQHGVNTRSLKTIDYHLKTLRPFFGDLLPSHVSNNLLKEYVAQRGVKAGTILRELGTLKAALHYAEGNRWIERQPQFIMPVKSPPPRDLWLKREEVVMLIEKAKSPHIALFIKIAVSTAARSGAILDLKWDQLDMEQRIIDFGRGYGNKRRSIVPMNDAVYEALLEAKELAQTDHVIEYNGRPTRAIKKAFSRLCESCGIKASPHVLRHTAATWLVMDGVPLSEVARLLGDSEKTVETVYGKHSPDYLRRAVTALNLTKNKPVLQL